MSIILSSDKNNPKLDELRNSLDAWDIPFDEKEDPDHSHLTKIELGNLNADTHQLVTKIVNMVNG